MGMVGIGTGTAAGSAAASGFGAGVSSALVAGAKGAYTGYGLSQANDYKNQILAQLLK